MNKITTEQVEMWLGSDCKRSEILEILADLANGDYDQKVLRTDIIATTQQQNNGDTMSNNETSQWEQLPLPFEDEPSKEDTNNQPYSC